MASGDEGLRTRFASARDRHQAWLRERTGPASNEIPVEELRAPSLFLPRRWQDALRGRPPQKPG